VSDWSNHCVFIIDGTEGESSSPLITRIIQWLFVALKP